MKFIRNIDSVAQALLFIGTAHHVAKGMNTRDDAHKTFSTPLNKLYLGLLGAAAIYRIGRLMGPKTGDEKRAARLTQLYNQAAGYRKRAQLYRNSAEVLLRRGIHNVKLPTNKDQ